MSGLARPSGPAIRPDLDVDFLYRMGRAAIVEEQFENAIEALERVVCLKPDHIDALMSLAHAHVAAGHVDDARAILKLLRARKPDTPMADFEEGLILSDLGQVEEAYALFARATRLHPTYAPAWHSLAKLKRVASDGKLIGELNAQIARTAEPSTNMMFLCMALAKAYEDVGEYDLAFEHQIRAKSQAPVVYDRAAEETRFGGARDVFTKEFFAKRSGFGAEENRPIFVLGMPRSGTSLTEQILASHPDVFGAGEPDFMALACGQLSSLTPDNAPVYRAALKINKETSVIFGRRYLRRLASLDRVHARVVDKTPHNFLRVGVIGLILPNASIVHCTRDPIDTCVSIFMQNFAQHHSYAHDLSSIGHYYQLYAQLMCHWREHSRIPICDLDHADLLRDQRTQTERLVAHVGLAWDERMIEFHKTERRVATPSRTQVRQPLNVSFAGRGRKYEKHLGPLIDALGPYAPT